MVTTAQIDRIGRRVDHLAAAIDADETVGVVVFAGESPGFALQRHQDRRPDHAGRPVRLEYRSEARCYVGELFAVHSDAEIQAVIERIDTKGAPQDGGRADAGRCARVGRRRADLTIDADRTYGLWQGHAADPGHHGIWCQPVPVPSLALFSQDPAT